MTVPCLEYACASGMSFLTSDTKGNLVRSNGAVAQRYGYRISVIDLRNPTRSHGNNLLQLVNRNIDSFLRERRLSDKAKAEK